MKKSLLLSSLLFIPIAVVTRFVMTAVDPSTGFFNGSMLLLAIDLILVLAAAFIGFSLSERAAGRGVLFLPPARPGFWKLLNATLAALVLANVVLKFIYSRPTDTNTATLWFVSVVFEDIALVCILLRVFAKPSEDPLIKVFHSIGPCLFFTAELLTRFFSSSVNRNNVPLMISFIACGSLAVSSLRMMQTLSFEETSVQRQFITAAYISFIICFGLRLPSVTVFKFRNSLFDIVCVILDCVAAAAVFYEACLTVPDTD